MTLSALSQHGDVEIAVRDTGVGIPPDAVAHIFDRFYRVDTARQNRIRGSGLGLALTRSTVEANGGHVLVDSVPGKGSTFTIQLPCAAPPEARALTDELEPTKR